MVRRRQDARRASDRRGPRGQDPVRPEDLGEDLFRLAREHPAVVRFTPALVGASDSGLVCPLGRGLCRGDGRSGLRRGARRRRRTRRSDRIRGASPGERSRATGRYVQARRGRARHLVLFGAVAVLDARLAGRRRRSSSASIRPTRSSPASTSSSSGSRG